MGLKDSYSGKTWGQVTKNGGTLQLSYDDGDAGFYVGGGGYSYRDKTSPAIPASTPTPGFICGLTTMSIVSCRPG